MKRLAMVIAFQMFALSASATEQTACPALCVGAVLTPPATSSTVAPLLVELSDSDLSAAGMALATLSAEQKKQTVVAIETTIEGADALTAAEERARTIVEWARLHGPFDAIALSVRHEDPAIVAFAIKRVAVTAQGLGVASRIAVRPTERHPLQSLFDQAATPYFDAVIVGCHLHRQRLLDE